MNFIDFKLAVQNKINSMSSGEMFVTDVNKDELYTLYLSSFPEGTNPIFRERTEHDCSCCKNFIRNIGNVVSFVDGELTTIWDINIGGFYQVVADALSDKVKEGVITDLYRHYEHHVGTDKNNEIIEGVVKEWNHFYSKLPDSKVMRKDKIPTFLGNVRTDKEVLESSLTNISDEAIDIVLDLITQEALYRGNEHKRTVQLLRTTKTEYNQADNKEIFLWQKSAELKSQGRFKNTVIGTLLLDISEGKDLEVAVKGFEVKVAPTNYKRPKALITQGMIDSAQKKVKELGLEESLARRYANVRDLTINNVLFADRSTQKVMKDSSVFDMLSGEVTDTKPNLDRVQEVGIKEFISTILPKAESIEVMLDNNHEQNLVSIIAPVNEGCEKLFKWGNPFSWSYNGEVADSMKELVKDKGGDVTGDVRFSIQWNDNNDNNRDLDAHCIQPQGSEIYFGNRGRRHPSSGMLDVDIISPNGDVAVENITFANKDSMPVGQYRFYVHNYSSGSGENFKAEVEFDGVIHKYEFNGTVRGGSKTNVATITKHKDGSLNIEHHLDSNSTPKEVWGVKTNKWIKVSMVMNSPNHWDGEETGNKHYMFLLDGCVNPEASRGFYNEFLREDLTPHRKVFEVLASKMKTTPCNDQLSGVGFSETQRNSLLCKVSGSFNRVIKINF